MITSLLEDCEDGALIRMTLAGQAECFRVLMERYIAPVRRRVASIVQNASDTEDVLQEVSFKVWRKLSTFRSESSFRTWLTRIAINEALGLRRRAARERLCQLPDDFEALTSTGNAIDEHLMRAEQARVLHSAVVSLPPLYRRVLILRDIKQLSSKETAERLNSTVPAVKTRLFRGRLMLIEALRRSTTKQLARKVA